MSTFGNNKIGEFLQGGDDDDVEIDVGEREFSAENYHEGAFKKGVMRHWTQEKTKDHKQRLHSGDALPDCSLYDLEEKTVKLSELTKGKVTVISFGSYSWKPWRKKTEALLNIVDSFQDQIHFFAIYIDEAHAIDEWKMFTDVCYRNPKNIQGRIGLAQQYKTEFNFKHPIYIDSMENIAKDLYSAWPERLYVVQDDRILFVGEEGPYGYKPEDVDSFLKQYFKKV